MLYLLIFLDIEKLHQFIVDIDLRPSMTQFLIVAFFTPILLITLQYYAQQENSYKLIAEHLNIENIKFFNLNNKYIELQNLIDDAKKDPAFYEKNPKFISDRFDNSIENLIKAFKEYEDTYNMIYLNDKDIVSTSDSYPINFDVHYRNIIFLYQLTNIFQTEQKCKCVSIYLKSFEKAYKEIEFKKIENLHNDFQKIEKLSLKYIKYVEALFVLIGGLSIYMIFRFILLYLRFHYIENILLKKLEQINSIDTWTKSDQNIIFEIKKNMTKVKLLDSISLIQVVKFKRNFWTLDKKLSTIIENEKITKIENECAKKLKI